ncbi:MAG: hypothetical protein HC907_38045, partial [Richelia sp. SM1_7_0]|nr:hypothetical protein [Richelia sp. SM1_7_0]
MELSAQEEEISASVPIKLIVRDSGSVNAESRFPDDAGNVNAESRVSGDAGNIDITAREILLDSQGKLIAATFGG